MSDSTPPPPSPSTEVVAGRGTAAGGATPTRAPLLSLQEPLLPLLPCRPLALSLLR
jgi:hypothetical protein